MSDYYWPHKIPTTLDLDYIYQVTYTIHPLNDKIFEVKQTNNYDNITAHRVHLPNLYQEFLKKFLWRIAILIKLYQTYKKRRSTKKYKTFLSRLAKCLVHLDNVIESLIRPAVSLSPKETEAYHSAHFEEFLVTEFLLGRHEPAIVQQYRETYDINIERMNPWGFDWDDYMENQIDGRLEGDSFEYDIGNVSRNDLKDIWEIAKEYYTRDIDHAWVSRWLDEIAVRNAETSDAVNIVVEVAGADTVKVLQSGTMESQSNTSSSGVVARLSPPPPNQLQRNKRTREATEEVEEGQEETKDIPPKKRSATHAAQVPQAFDASLNLDPPPSYFQWIYNLFLPGT